MKRLGLTETRAFTMPHTEFAALPVKWRDKAARKHGPTLERLRRQWTLDTPMNKDERKMRLVMWRVQNAQKKAFLP